MLLAGLLTAVLLATAWIVIQIAWMHWRPAQNRLAAMAIGYLVSLPFTWSVFALVVRWLEVGPDANTTLGLLHAFLLGLLLFFLYVECFYHVERSVTLRFLVEIDRRSATVPPVLADIQGDYSLEDMIARRLELLQENGFIEQRDGRWHLRPKGQIFCRAMAFSCWLFQSKTQDQRL